MPTKSHVMRQGGGSRWVPFTVVRVLASRGNLGDDVTTGFLVGRWLPMRLLMASGRSVYDAVGGRMCVRLGDGRCRVRYAPCKRCCTFLASCRRYYACNRATRRTLRALSSVTSRFFYRVGRICLTRRFTWGSLGLLVVRFLLRGPCLYSASVISFYPGRTPCNESYAPGGPGAGGEPMSLGRGPRVPCISRPSVPFSF